MWYIYWFVSTGKPWKLCAHEAKLDVSTWWKHCRPCYIQHKFDLIWREPCSPRTELSLTVITALTRNSDWSSTPSELLQVIQPGIWCQYSHHHFQTTKEFSVIMTTNCIASKVTSTQPLFHITSAGEKPFSNTPRWLKPWNVYIAQNPILIIVCSSTSWPDVCTATAPAERTCLHKNQTKPTKHKPKPNQTKQSLVGSCFHHWYYRIVCSYHLVQNDDLAL